MEEKKMAKPSINDIARIFEDVGGYYVCSESEDYLDTRGKAYPTKSEAQRAAARAGYTHMVGSGTPAGGGKIQPIPKKYRDEAETRV